MIHFINEDGNSDLKGKRFHVPDGILSHLKATFDQYNGDKSIEGYKRLGNMIDMGENHGGIAYNEMKRVKSWFDNHPYSADTAEYTLNGGNIMRNWIDSTLGHATNVIKAGKQALKDAGVDNAFRKPHEKDRQTKPSKPTTAKIVTKDVAKNIGNNTSVKLNEGKTIIVKQEIFEKILV